MSTRTYSGTLVLESIFDAIPSQNDILVRIANRIFSPDVPIVDDDCGTLLGDVIPLTSESEGLISVEAGVPITRATINSKLAAGIYEINVRSIPTCISSGGICQKCFQSSRPGAVLPAVGTKAKIHPEFILNIEPVTVHFTTDSAELTLTPDRYDKVYIYNNGVLLTPFEYQIMGTTLTMTITPSVDTVLIVKYVVVSRVPFFYWMADTYAGSLLGIKALPISYLSLKPSLFTSLIPESEVDYLVTKLRASELIPFEVKEYLPKIKSLMEKALFAIAVDSVFSNVTT